MDRYLARRAGEDAEFRKVWDAGEVELGLRKAIIGARLAAGLSQVQLARQLGIGEALVTRLEVGAYRPRLETLVKIAAELNVAFEIDGTGLHLRG